MIRKSIVVTIILLGAFSICSPAGAKNNKQKPLPPGLQKNMQRGKALPPGWQKKLAKGEILDKDIFNRGIIIVPPDMNGLMTIRVEDKLIRLLKSTREIVDILEK